MALININAGEVLESTCSRKVHDSYGMRLSQRHSVSTTEIPTIDAWLPRVSNTGIDERVPYCTFGHEQRRDVPTRFSQKKAYWAKKKGPRYSIKLIELY